MDDAPKLDYATPGRAATDVHIEEDEHAVTVTFAPPAAWKTGVRVVIATLLSITLLTMLGCAVALGGSGEGFAIGIVMGAGALCALGGLWLFVRQLGAEATQPTVVEVRDHVLTIRWPGKRPRQLRAQDVAGITINTMWSTPATTAQLKVRRRRGFAMTAGQSEAVDDVRYAARRLRERLGLPPPARRGCLGILVHLLVVGDTEEV